MQSNSTVCVELSGIFLYCSAICSIIRKTKGHLANESKECNTDTSEGVRYEAKNSLGAYNTTLKSFVNFSLTFYHRKLFKCALRIG